MDTNITISNTLKSAIFVANAYKATIASKYDEKRHAEMKRLITNEMNKTSGFDDGILGRVIELYCRDSNSTLIKVRTQGKCDAYIPTTSGKRVKAEIKTNGGQVHELMKLSRKEQENTFCVYFSHTKVPTSKSDAPTRYYNCFKIMTIAEFLDSITTKENKSKNAINIQPTSKKMYARLEQFADFKRNTAYTI